MQGWLLIILFLEETEEILEIFEFVSMLFILVVEDLLDIFFGNDTI